MTPEFTAALLRNAISEMKSQSWGSRAVRREPRLVWDVLVSLFCDKEKLKQAIDRTRNAGVGGPGYAKTLQLADKYATGW